MNSYTKHVSVLQLIALLFCSTVITNLHAQYTDTIQVVDEEGFPVIGATIYLATLNRDNEVAKIDSSQQYLTDVNGKVIIKDIPYKAYLHFSSIQHREKNLSIHSIRADNLQVVLQTGFITTIEVIGKGTTNEKSPLSEVPNQVTVIDDKDIVLHNPQTSADVLSQSGNVYVQKSQMGGGSPIIRGFEANKVLLVLDGVRLNNAIYRSGHLQNVITIDNSTIERVEVHHGPGSVMYGSDALGGVMHFYTQTPRFRSKEMRPFVVKAHTRFSTANTESTSHIDVNVGTQRFASFTSLTYSSFRDLRAGRIKTSEDMALYWNRYFYVEHRDSVDQVLVNKNPNEQLGTHYAQLDVVQKLRYKPKDGLEFLLNFQYSTTTDVPRYDQLTDGDITIQNGQITKQTFRFAEWFYGPQTRWFTALTTKIKSKKKSVFTDANIILAFQKIRENRTTRRFGRPLRRIQEEDVYVVTFNADFIKNFGKRECTMSKLLYGLEATHNIVHSRVETQNILTGENSNRGIGTRYPDGGSMMTTAGIYASYKIKLGKRINIITGARYAIANVKASFRDTLLYKLPYSTISSFNHAITGSVALTWEIAKGLQFNTALSTSFRTPNIDDNGKIRAKRDNITIPNPNIRPEQALNGEATLGKQFGKKAWVGGTFFYTRIFDAILQEPAQLNGSDSMYYDGSFRTIYSNVNAGQAFIWGVSANVKVEFSDKMFMRLGVNYTRGRELETGRNPRPLAHIPPLYGHAEWSYERKSFQTRFNVRFNGPKKLQDYSDDSSENLDKALPEGTPAWFTVNIYSSFRLNKFLNLDLGIENLLDWHYRPYGSGVSASGINVIVALKGSF